MAQLGERLAFCLQGPEFEPQNPFKNAVCEAHLEP